MSDLFVNKIAAAGLTAALVFIGINKFAGFVVHPDEPSAAEFAYSLAPVEAPKHTEEVPIPFPSPLWIASMDTEKGKKVFKKCSSCHNVDNGGKNATGPALWNIVGRPIGESAGFSYSSNMAAKGGTWGYEELDAFLTKPKKYIPKTKMAFNGLKKEEDRAALIAYLRARADSPMAMIEASAPVIEETHVDTMQEHVETIQETAVKAIEEHAPEMPSHDTPKQDAPKQDGGH